MGLGPPINSIKKAIKGPGASIYSYLKFLVTDVQEVLLFSFPKYYAVTNCHVL